MVNYLVVAYLSVWSEPTGLTKADKCENFRDALRISEQFSPYLSRHIKKDIISIISSNEFSDWTDIFSDSL